MQSQIDAAVLAERERCAKIVAEAYRLRLLGLEAAITISDKIRERK